MAVELLAAADGNAAVEGDVERVQRGLPPVGPAGSSLAGGVEAGDGKVQHFQRSLFGGEMAAGVDSSAQPGVQALNRVGTRYEIGGGPRGVLLVRPLVVGRTV